MTWAGSSYLHSPSNWCGLEKSINLVTRKSWCSRGRALVKRSASWLWELTYGRWRRPERTCWRMKWQSTSMCLVLSWKTGLFAIYITLVLLALRGVAPRIGIPSSWRRRRSQTIILLAEDMDLYSASAEDLETVACFLHVQEMREEPRNIHQPVVNLLVSGHPAQSASA